MARSIDPVVRLRRSAADTREQITTVAAKLFYRDGIRATGVDTIAARVGVAPPTLYRHFATKDELVGWYVERCSADYRERLTALSSASTGTTRERLVAIFALFMEDATSPECRGCPFQLVLAEFPDPASPAHQQAVAHKAWVRDLLTRMVGELAGEVAVEDPVALAEQLTVVAEGIYSAAQTLGHDGPARNGRACAESLIAFAIADRR